MKVTLLRDHLSNKKGDSIEVTPERAAYWQRIGLVDGAEKKEFKPQTEKNSKAGPGRKKKK